LIQVDQFYRLNKIWFFKEARIEKLGSNADK